MGLSLDYYWQKVQEKGDENALEWIFKNTYPSLCFYAFQIVGDRFLSEEIVQDVFTNLWQNRNKIAIKGSFKAYLYQSVRNLAINVLIQNSTLKKSVNNLVSIEFWQEIQNNLKFEAFLIEKLEAEETQLVIDKAISELPEQCREIFKLSRNEFKSNDEIADYLGISVNTVRTQIFRALEKIKEALEKNK
jgi:RNA polymerase sigma-70 factor (ECF subfamily)